jgi:hypothetical protein
MLAGSSIRFVRAHGRAQRVRLRARQTCFPYAAECREGFGARVERFRE